MKPTKNDGKTTGRFFILAIWCIFPLLTPVISYAADEPKAATADKAVATPPVDPFKPFIEIADEARQRKARETKKAPAFLPVLQKFAVQEFRLVGIAWNGKKRVAMVEDSRGKFYPLYKGTQIGLNEGKVKEIQPDQVIIIEKIEDAAGERKLAQVVLSLKREVGGE